MLNTGKCPKCEHTITFLQIEAVEVKEGFTSAWKGATFLCPHCKAVVGAGLDPIALKTDIINGVAKKLGRS